MLRGRGFHRVIHQCFLCKCQIKGKCQCKYWSLRKSKVIKVIPIDEALADSEAEGCWVLA
jgi:hypothetical protein